MADPTTSPTPAPISDDAVNSFLSLDESGQSEMLGKLSAGTKSSLLATLKSRASASSPSPAPVTPPGPSLPVPAGLQTPTDFSSRVGERIRQGVNLIPRMANIATGKEQPTEAEHQFAQHISGQDHPTTLGKVAGALTTGPRMVWDQLKSYSQDPANLVGDLTLAAPELAEHGPAAVEALRNGTKKPAVPPPPSVEPSVPTLSPEQQDTYSAQIDKINTQLKATTQKYYDKMTQAFDESKRAQLAGEAEHTAALDKAKKDYADAVAKEQQARSQWVEKTHAARESARQQAMVEGQRSTLQKGQEAAAQQARENLASTQNAVKSSLDNRYAQIREAIGSETPTNVENTIGAITDAKAKGLRGSPESIKQFNDILREANVNAGVPAADEIAQGLGYGDAQEASAKMGKDVFQQYAEKVASETGMDLNAVPKKELPWETARVQASAIGSKLASGNLPGNVYQALKQVHDALQSDLATTAESKGMGKAYSALRNDYAQYMSDWNDLGNISTGRGSPLAKAVRAPNTKFLQSVATGKAGDLLLERLSKYRDFGAVPEHIKNIQTFTEREKALPKVRVKSTPAPYQGKTPELAVPPPPGMPEVKTLPSAPGEPKLPVRPTPEDTSAKAGPALKHSARIVGKVAGGAVGSALGHPLLGYGVGGELGSELADRIAARRGKPAVPPPPR